MKELANIIIIGICFILLLCVISSFCLTVIYNNKQNDIQNDIPYNIDTPLTCPKCPTCVNEGSVYQV